MDFTLTPTVNRKVQVHIIPLQGNMVYDLSKVTSTGDKEEINCPENGGSCIFMSESLPTDYLISIKGSPELVETFTIGFIYPADKTKNSTTDPNNTSKCLEYPMNTPMKINLPPQEEICLKYNLK